MPEVTVHHEILKRSGRIRFRKFRPGGYEHYKIRVYIDGPLSNISRVQYELHATFQNPIRESTEPSSGFEITFWTYGEFEIVVTVFFKGRRYTELLYQLEYSHELPSDDERYIDETPEDIAG